MVQEMPGLADTYPFCTYSLTSFKDIPDPSNRPARFIDVIGTIDMVSDIVPVQSIYQTAASNTRTIILKDILGNELRLILWGEHALEFDAEAVRAMGAKEPVIAIFVGTLPKMSHGVKSLSGSSACRWYIDEDIPDINLFRERLGPQFVPLAAYVPTGLGAIIPRVFEAPIEKTTQELNDDDPFVDMECQLHQVRWVGQEIEAIVSDPLCLRTSPVYKVLVCMALTSCLVPVVSSAAMNHMKSLSVS
ncbi:hypothetical protein ACQ4PT_034029 [Festuca glaucescens]